MPRVQLAVVLILALDLFSLSKVASARPTQGASNDVAAGLQAEVAELKSKVLSVCKLSPGATPTLPSTKVYEGNGLAGIATSPTGIVALADLGTYGDDKGSRVIIYTHGLSADPISVPIPGAFTQYSLKISNDGYYVAWMAGIQQGPTIYDVRVRKSQDLSQTSNPCADQWIGDDLLIHDCPDTMVLFRLGPAGFAPFHTASAAIDLKDHSESREAISDQLGESFIKGGVVYPSREAAEAAGAVVVSPIGAAYPPIRAGQDLFLVSGPRFNVPDPVRAKQVEWANARSDGPDKKIIVALASRRTPGLVRMSDLRSIDLKNADCYPGAIAVSPNGNAIAILQGGVLIQILDPKTLSVISSFRIDRPWDRPPQEIAYASDDTLLVMTRTDVSRYVVAAPPL
jgi:hypothetical protein